MSSENETTSADVPAWPTKGPSFNAWWCDAAEFVRMFQENPTAWLNNFQIKYISLRIDNRSGAFRLYDRDGNEIEPAVVQKAVREIGRAAMSQIDKTTKLATIAESIKADIRAKSGIDWTKVSSHFVAFPITAIDRAIDTFRAAVEELQSHE